MISDTEWLHSAAETLRTISQTSPTFFSRNLPRKGIKKSQNLQWLQCHCSLCH